MKPIQKKYKLRDKRRPNQNMPSRRYQVNMFWEVFQEDQRYCGGHRSNGKYHKKFSRILRAKEKAETMKEVKECELK